eukprot:Gb_37546 [translate_table: standard]
MDRREKKIDMGMVTWVWQGIVIGIGNAIWVGLVSGEGSCPVASMIRRMRQGAKSVCKLEYKPRKAETQAVRSVLLSYSYSHRSGHMKLGGGPCISFKGGVTGSEVQEQVGFQDAKNKVVRGPTMARVDRECFLVGFYWFWKAKRRACFMKVGMCPRRVIV